MDKIKKLRIEVAIDYLKFAKMAVGNPEVSNIYIKKAVDQLIYVENIKGLEE